MKEIIQAEKIDAKTIEHVLLAGDLRSLTPAQRLAYYKSVCDSLGLNPLTRPFDYIVLNNKLTLYAKKDAADQLRRIHGVSIDKPDIMFKDDLIIVTVTGRIGDRSDAEIGVVNTRDMQGNLANAIMKAVTKAKRRLTLSMCGLGFLDETEVETIPEAKFVQVNDSGEIVHETPVAPKVDQPNQDKADYGDRPFEPEVLLATLKKVALKYGNIEPTKNDIISVAATISTYIGEDGRKKLIKAIWGVDSMKDMGTMVLALKRWLKPQYDGEERKFFSSDEDSPVELLALYSKFVGEDEDEDAQDEEQDVAELGNEESESSED